MKTDSPGFWTMVDRVLDHHGVIVVFLLLMFGFVCFIFWRLTWNVWKTAMKAKDDEIERLVKERDKYQALVFDSLRSSAAVLPKLKERS